MLENDLVQAIVGLPTDMFYKGKPQPDSALRDTENVPLHEDVAMYFKREAPVRLAGSALQYTAILDD